MQRPQGEAVGKDADLAGLCRERGRLGADRDTPRVLSSNYLHMCMDIMSFGQMYACAQSVHILRHMPSSPAMSQSMHTYHVQKHMLATCMHTHVQKHM